MARSKIKGTNGKPVARTKKKSSNRASVKIEQRKDGDYDVTKRNDGDPSITASYRDRRKTVKGPDKVTTKNVTRTRASKNESAASKKADKDWQNAPSKSSIKNPDGTPRTNLQNYSGSGGINLPKRGTSGRPRKKYDQEKYTERKTVRTPTKKPNPKYNQKSYTTQDYSDKAKNPGGHILGIPKKEKMTPAQKRAYLKYLKSK